MIGPLSTPNNFAVYGQKHKVWVLIFLVRTRGTRCDQNHFMKDVFSFMHRGCALFSLWSSPHHGWPKMVEIKDLMFVKIK